MNSWKTNRLYAKDNTRTIGAFVLSCGIMLMVLASPSNDAYEAYYLYLGDHPSEAKPGWHTEVQGLTHDRDNWFIAQKSYLWKIPVTHDLNSVSPNDPGVIRINLGNVSQLVNAGYNHFGDPEYFEFQGQGYLVVPIEDTDHRTPCNAIAAFKADTLEYLASCCLSEQQQAPWVAVDPAGNTYSSNGGGVTQVNKYSVDWPALRDRKELILTKIDSVELLNEQGNTTTLNSLQGGVISPSGRLLYLVANGIHVFDTVTGIRIQRSTNGSGYFNYEFNPDFPFYEEPEGLTIWDLDDGRAPGIKGQLHVLLLDNEFPTDDEVYLKHYTGTIYVDHNYNGEEKGTPYKPFITVTKANNFAWDGAQIKIRSGLFPETLTFSKRIRVLSERGPAIIGQ